MNKSKFHITIDDEKGSLNKENGISINIIGDLLKGLYKAIDDGKKLNCTLSDVSGNCYRLDFASKDLKHGENFIDLHENIKQLNFDQLPNKQRDYANALRAIFKNKYFLKAFSNNEKITTIKEIKYDKKIDSYFTFKTIYGYLSRVSHETVSSTVKIDGYPRLIKVKDGEDISLNPYYRKQKLRVRLREKKSVNGGRIISSELVSFEIVNKGTLSQNLKTTGYVELNALKGKKSLNEIISSLYDSAD